MSYHRPTFAPLPSYGGSSSSSRNTPSPNAGRGFMNGTEHLLPLHSSGSTPSPLASPGVPLSAQPMLGRRMDGSSDRRNGGQRHGAQRLPDPPSDEYAYIDPYSQGRPNGRPTVRYQDNDAHSGPTGFGQANRAAGLRGDLRNDGGAQARRRPTVRERREGLQQVMNNAAPGRTGTLSRGLTRGKTLIRPERHVAPTPLINPTAALSSQLAMSSSTSNPFRFIRQLFTGDDGTSPLWRAYCWIVTCWAPAWLLSLLGKTDPVARQAWREKMGLCSIAVIMGGIVGFATIGLNRVLCPAQGSSTPNTFIRLGENPDLVGINGWMFNVTSQAKATNGVNFVTLSKQMSGLDVTDYFDRSKTAFASCSGDAKYVTTSLCIGTGSNTTCPLAAPTPAYLSGLGLLNTSRQVGMAWEQVTSDDNSIVIDGNVLNLEPYLNANPTAIDGDHIDAAIRYTLSPTQSTGGKDATRLFYRTSELRSASACLVERYKAGHIDKITPGCFASQLFLYTSLCVIMGVILARFAMATVFSWFLSKNLVKPPKNLRRKVVSPAVLPEGANIEVNNPNATAPWTMTPSPQKGARAAQRRPTQPKGTRQGAGVDEKLRRKKTVAKPVDGSGMINMAAIGAELFCVCLVTCYSEGEQSIKSTLDSIAATHYSDARKLLFIVCDGMVSGAGEKTSTPDICVSMLDADPRFGDPLPMKYTAIGVGGKEQNEAMVYAGHYTKVSGHRTPTIIVVKCGTSEEARDKKPGNRGKRDSQMVLMNFFQRVTYNDRMTPLDYDLFRKTQALMGVTPDFFEVTLMVDADTKIWEDSLTQLVNCMQHDNMIMGVCGETRISNKRQSWVTAIQVFEYYISHHLAKGFESVFGGVTCLPGCFSMYRLKARKMDDSDWVPILSKAEIVREYSQSVVTTLHQKNLLLLGEDRFLTTSMIRTFPNRKMIFCPQARCHTVVPDAFSVLLSQRRRWINSTVHNLMELVRVRNLCGTFCFSMQFVVSLELVGTIVLPVAICLTYSLIINYCFNPPTQFADAIPLILLAGVLGLPAVLIAITSGKLVYILWMLIYLIALPIWNFVLPIYAFSKFDDFSWGETRRVEGEGKDKGHATTGGAASTTKVPLRRWEAWERSRLRKLERDAKRIREFEQINGPGQMIDKEAFLRADRLRVNSTTPSYTSDGEEQDQFGGQIGQYNEYLPGDQPPPVGLYIAGLDDDAFTDAGTIDANELEMALEGGWDDEDEDVYEKEPSYSSRPSTGRYDSGAQTPLSSESSHQHVMHADLGSTAHLLTSLPRTHDTEAHSTSFEAAPRGHARNRSKGSGGHAF
ncbi:glycosyltransferase family 2 protein [Mixia osmundae IAM 14324]|uniref:chitin synthase n=1 Tax=Mixia osmundae (strain CBS 9802 / IAM 14324 / JCM 22182 / KY 12970) TaxID=764103 RepID=G7E324_MIXOS|nr:glycosyltransferase family 2 protein [Mixia osmundae IAM 14324]KEI42506.1 glycosyltransferase family 2 protein [Mixia osmundae IAM 14324]GAA97205.1 hypothetical protein E5Q_03881 [Mixia osmundae IAM 14324]